MIMQIVQDGVWAGNMEVQAASICFGRNIHIYQQGQACWRVCNFSPPEKHACIHLSYHNGDHYNSVRLQSDDCNGLPDPIDLLNCRVDMDTAAAEEVCAV
jgi:OTU domain-containing protein 3